MAFDSKTYMKEYYKKNSEKIKLRAKRYKENNKEKYRLSNKRWRENNKEKKNETDRLYRLNHPEIVKKWRQVNKEYINKYNEMWYLKNQERRREYRIRNRERARIMERKRLENPLVRMTSTLRTRVGIALRKNQKCTNTMNLVGCSKERLLNHLESQFDDEMNWTNYGKWHVDHINPCKAFNLTEPEEQKKCFNYTNLQPLWAEINLKKNAKIY